MSRETLDLLELAALEAAERGDGEAVAAIRPGLSFEAMVKCIALLKEAEGWSGTSTFIVHTILILEHAPPPGVEMTVNWPKVLGPDGIPAADRALRKGLSRPVA